jgi:hypothetical protein
MCTDWYCLVNSVNDWSIFLSCLNCDPTYNAKSEYFQTTNFKSDFNYFHLLINNLFQFDETKSVGMLIMEIKRITACPAKLSFASVQKDPISDGRILKDLNLPSSNYLKLKCVDKSCQFSIQQSTPSVIEVNNSGIINCL